MISFDDRKCDYCYFPFRISNLPRKLDCSHRFCDNCIDFLNQNEYCICPLHKEDCFIQSNLPVDNPSFCQILGQCKYHYCPFTYISDNPLSFLCDFCATTSQKTLYKLTYETLKLIVEEKISQAPERLTFIEYIFQSMMPQLEKPKNLAAKYTKLCSQISGLNKNFLALPLESKLDTLKKLEISLLEVPEPKIYMNKCENEGYFSSGISYFLICNELSLRRQLNSHIIMCGNSVRRYPNNKIPHYLRFYIDSTKPVILKSVGIGLPFVIGQSITISSFMICNQDMTLAIYEDSEVKTFIRTNEGKRTRSIKLRKNISLESSVVYVFKIAFEAICYYALETCDMISEDLNIRYVINSYDNIFFYFRIYRT